MYFRVCIYEWKWIEFQVYWHSGHTKERRCCMMISDVSSDQDTMPEHCCSKGKRDGWMCFGRTFFSFLQCPYPTPTFIIIRIMKCNHVLSMEGWAYPSRINSIKFHLGFKGLLKRCKKEEALFKYELSWLRHFNFLSPLCSAEMTNTILLSQKFQPSKISWSALIALS